MKGILFKPDMIKAIRENRKTVTRRLAGLKEINQEPGKWELSGFNEGGKLDFGVVRFWRKDDINIPALVVKPRYQVGETVYIKEAHYRFGHWQATGGVTENGRTEYEFVAETEEVRYLENPPDSFLIGPYGYFNGTAWYKRSPLFMPAWAARYFLKITDVRAEKLCGITEEDAIAEGTIRYPDKIRQGHIYRTLSDYTYEAYPLKWGFIKGEKLKADYPSLGLARLYSLDKRDGQCIHLSPKDAFSLLEDEEMSYREAYQYLWDSINKDYPWESNPWVFRYEFEGTEK